MTKSRAKKALERLKKVNFVAISVLLGVLQISVNLYKTTALAGDHSIAKMTFKSKLLPRRISSRVVDLGKVHTLRMSVGMATLVELPAPISGKISGSPEADLMVLNGPESTQIILELKRAEARPTNLILVSGKRKVVFDIIPSDQSHPTHQDVYEISGFYGGPEIDENREAVIIDSSEKPEKAEAK